jgi:tRNA (guanine-N7-)-methyltransferase
MAYARRTLPALFEFRERFEPWSDMPQGRTLREIVARSQGLAIFRAEARPLELHEALRETRLAALPPPDFDANK